MLFRSFSASGHQVSYKHKKPCLPNAQTGNTAEIINETLAGNIQIYNKSSVIQELHDFGNIFGVFAGIDPVVIVIVRNKRTVC